MLSAADVLVRILASVSRGADLKESILGRSFSVGVEGKDRPLERPPDRVVVGGILSSAFATFLMHFLPHFFLHIDMLASQQTEFALMHNVVATHAIAEVSSARYWRQHHLYPSLVDGLVATPRIYGN